MPIKATLKQLVESRHALDAFAQKSWPSASIKISYALGKLYRGALDELKQYDEARLKLLKEHGDEIRPNMWRVKDEREHVDAYNEGIKQLEEVVKDDLYGKQITLAQIEEAGLPMSPAEWALLDWLIIEG